MNIPLLIDPYTLSVYLALKDNAEIRALLLALDIVLPDDSVDEEDDKNDV